MPKSVSVVDASALHLASVKESVLSQPESVIPPHRADGVEVVFRSASTMWRLGYGTHTAALL